MARLRASFASARLLRSSASIRFSADSVCSGALQSGQRLANPGLSGFSSNSSEQMTQILIGNDIPGTIIQLTCSPRLWRYSDFQDAGRAHPSRRIADDSTDESLSYPVGVTLDV